MGNRFITSDHHLMHDGMYRFTNPDGSAVRPWAQDSAEGDEMMIEAWNGVVHPKDTVYHLGDIAIRRGGLQLLGRLNGRKILVRGNHDIFKLSDYTPWFEDIRGSHKIDRLILSHYPIHPDSIPHWCDANVHGHTHSNGVTMISEDGERVPDPRYLNACVEAIGLSPVPVEKIAERAASLAEERRSARL